MPFSDTPASAASWPRHATRFVLILGLVLRLGMVWAFRNSAPAPDAVDDYFPISQNVLAGNGFVNAVGEPDIVRGPVYPLFVAVAQLVSNKFLLPLLVLQALVDTLTCWIVAGICRRLFGEAAAICGALLYALNPLSIYACGLTVPETLFTCLFAAACACYLRGLSEETIPVALGEQPERSSLRSGLQPSFPILSAGILIGLATLCRSTPLLLIVPWSLCLLWRIRGWAGARQALLLAAACGAVILPWTIRNAVVFHEFIPVVANGGSNLYAGSERAFWTPPPAHHQLRLARYQQLVADGLIGLRPEGVGPGAGDKFNFSLALANYRRQWQADPLDVLQFMGEKSGRLWYASQSGRGQTSVGLINFTMLGLAMVGGLFAWLRLPQRRIELFAIGTSVFYFAAVLSLLFPQARYIVGFTPLLAILAAPVISYVWNLLRGLAVNFSFTSDARTRGDRSQHLLQAALTDRQPA